MMLNAILLVEDEQTTAQLLGDFLSGFCENLYFAQNGKEALNIYSKKELDLIITDIEMPILNGLELIKEIREKDNTTKLFCMSAYNNEKIYKSIEKYSSIETFHKPIDLEILELKLKELSS